MLHYVYLYARLSLPVTLVTFELTMFLLFFTPFHLLNFFVKFIFILAKKWGGGGLQSPSPSLCAVPVDQNVGPLRTLGFYYNVSRKSKG